MQNLIIYFLTGGIVTTLIVYLEQTGNRILSGIMALIPIFTLISYIFIGDSKGGMAVSKHSQFVLVGTLLSWVPYMMVVSYFAPRIGPHKAIALGMAVFFVLATIFVVMVGKYNLFQG